MSKRHLVIVGMVTVVMALAATIFAEDYKAQGESAAGKTPPVTSEYLVVSPHTSEECMDVLDEVVALGSDILSRYDWGCMSGDHSAYIRVQANSEAEALKVVPKSVRAKARAVKLVKFTPEQIRAAHESH